MYQVTVKGRTIEELKNAVADIHSELSCRVSGLTRNLDLVHHVGGAEEEMEEVESPYTSPLQQAYNEIAADAERDSEGMPWCATIHASSKAKNKDGSWRVKRGVEDSEVAKYKAQFQNTSANARPPEADPVLVPEFDQGVPTRTEPVVNQPVTPAAAPTPSLPMPSMNSGHTLDTFKSNFPMIVASLITEKKITQDYVNELKAFFKVDEIWKVTDSQKEMMFAQWTSSEYNLIQRVG